MNKLTQLFQEKKDLLALYFTAGFPQINDMAEIIRGFETGTADVLEIGIPFSDPMADGPVIQQSGQQALENGMTVGKLFEILETLSSGKPKVIMTYFNPVFRFGVERFCKMAQAADIQGLIIPDLPFEMVADEYHEIFNNHNLHFIPFITDKTSDARLELALKIGSGFIYLASAHIITGGKTGLSFSEDFKEKIKNLQQTLQVMIGFGIRNHEQYRKACQISNGAIVGTAFIQALEKSTDAFQTTINFSAAMKGGGRESLYL
jgi:tryptophan synthase alpha chain